MVCRVKSTSGTGFLCMTARANVRSCSMAASGRWQADRMDRMYLDRRTKGGGIGGWVVNLKEGTEGEFKSNGRH